MSRAHALIGLGLVAATISSPAGAQAPSRLAITSVNIVDLRQGRVDSNRTLLIQGDSLAGIVPAGSAPRGFSVVRELAGTFVIPGLWDMHVHLGRSGRSTLPLYLANGIIGVRDMGGQFSVIRALRDSVASGTLLGPDILLAGPIVERASWLNALTKYAAEHADSGLARDMRERIPISSIETAIAAVDSIVALGADFVKIRNDAQPLITLALLRRARERGIKVVGHWPAALTAKTASDSGYASLEHGPLTVVNRQLVPATDTMSMEQRNALFALLARNGTAYSPTFVSGKGFRLTPDSTIARILADTVGKIDPRMRYVPRDLIESWRSGFAATVIETEKPDWAAFQRSFLRDIRPMADAGVLLLAGTDVGSPLVFPAFSLVEELETLVADAGLTPLESLRTATLNVGTWLGKPNAIGVVAPGARADLVFLEANPLADIRSVRRIRGVLRRGQLLNAGTLKELVRP